MTEKDDAIIRQGDRCIVVQACREETLGMIVVVGQDRPDVVCTPCGPGGRVVNVTSLGGLLTGVTYDGVTCRDKTGHGCVHQLRKLPRVHELVEDWDEVPA
jgi:hypothetical protein